MNFPCGCHLCAHFSKLSNCFSLKTLFCTGETTNAELYLSPPCLFLGFEDGWRGARWLAGEKTVGTTCDGCCGCFAMPGRILWTSRCWSCSLLRTDTAEEWAVIPEGSERKPFVFSESCDTSLSLIDLPVLNIRRTSRMKQAARTVLHCRRYVKCFWYSLCGSWS